jgi:hypothetical protein
VLAKAIRERASRYWPVRPWAYPPRCGTPTDRAKARPRTARGVRSELRAKVH